MSDPSIETHLSMSHHWVEVDNLADYPVHASIANVLRQAEASRLDVQPHVISRGAASAAEQKLLEAIAQKLGVEQEYEAWLRVRRGEMDKMHQTIPAGRPVSSGIIGDVLFPGLPGLLTPSSSEMWWARSDWVSPAGMDAEFRPDGLHLFGQLNWADGDLWQGSLQVTATFALDPSRMPPGGPGWFTSIPHCELFGQITGATASLGGDNWSKCWLHTAQLVHGGPGGGRIGEGHSHQNLFFIEHDNVLAPADLPGFTLFPRVDFHLEPAHDLVIVLEVRFDFQLEGGAQIWFGSQKQGQPPIHRDALLRTFQWKIQRS